MKILGLDSSQERLNLAIIEENKVLAESSREAKGILTEIILSEIDKTLKEAELTLSQLSGLATSIGPGSYTGLRVGLSVAKALAWSNKLPLIAVPTFEVIAFQSAERKSIVAVITQARQGEILGCLFEFKKSIPVQKGEYFVCSLDKLRQLIPAGTMVTRIGEKPEEEILKKSLQDREILTKSEITIPRGSSVAKLGLERLKAGQTADPKSIEPIYLQKAIYRSKIANEWISYPVNDRE